MADRADRSDSGVPESGSLPAPYANPWSSLAQDLRAVAADLRLRLQELWRRNREGDLSTPGFWPRDLAPLFWPLALALPALLLAAGVMQWQRLHPEPPPHPQVEQLTTTPLPEARLLPDQPATKPVQAPVQAPAKIQHRNQPKSQQRHPSLSRKLRCRALTLCCSSSPLMIPMG